MGWLSWLRRADTSPISNPAPSLVAALGGSTSFTGISVTRQRALTCSAVWGGVSMIAGDVAALPLMLYRRVGEDRERDTGNPLYSTLHDQANPEMSSLDFRRALMVNTLLHGNGYALIDRNMDDSRINLWPIDSSIMQVDRDRQTRELVYKVHTDRGIVELAPEDVIHVRGLSHDGVSGIGLLTAAKQAIGHALAVSEFSARHFANNAQNPVVFRFPPGTKKESMTEFLRKWQEKQTLEHSSKAAAFPGEIEMTPLGISAKESQLVEAAGWTTREVANFLNLNASHLNDVGKTSTYSSRLMESQAYLDRTLRPWLLTIEAELTRKLIPGDDSLIIEHNVQALLQANVSEQIGVFTAAISAGILTPEECRRLWNLPKLEKMPGPKPEPQPQPAPQGGEDDED